MTINEVLEYIVGTQGQFFSVKFRKRTTGESRTMNCRTGVRKHLKGGKGSYDPVSRDLVWVWDRHLKDYRSIPIEGITHISRNKAWEEVTHGPQKGCQQGREGQSTQPDPHPAV